MDGCENKICRYLKKTNLEAAAGDPRTRPGMFHGVKYCGRQLARPTHTAKSRSCLLISCRKLLFEIIFLPILFPEHMGYLILAKAGLTKEHNKLLSSGFHRKLGKT